MIQKKDIQVSEMKIDRRQALRAMLGTSAAFLCFDGLSVANVKSMTPEVREQGKRYPNVLLIIADDLGVGDVSCYGSKMIQTPNIDRIAAQGVFATDAHATASVCTPSRYSILTGRYYNHYPYNWNGECLIEPNRPTIASVFHNNGYKTGYFGKYHSGWGDRNPGRKNRLDIDWNKQLPRGVLDIGFDSYFGTPFTHNEAPFVFVKDRQVVGLDPNDPLVVVPPPEGPWGWGYSKGAKAAHAARPVDQIDLIVTEHAVNFIKENRERPFFVNLALVAPHVPISPSEKFKGKSKLGVYGDFVLQMDWCVGRILNTLEELKLQDNTIVIFTSDNGAIYYPDEWKRGHRANLNWLGQKTDAWEGGVRIPFIARWPGKIPAGKKVDSLISLMDIPQTVWAAAGIDVPPNAGPESLNQLAILTCKTTSPVRTELLMQGITGLALRSGDWVYIPKQGSQGVTTNKKLDWAMQFDELGFKNSDYDEQGNLKPDAPDAQLYNLRENPNQSTNVIRKYPQKAAELSQRLKQLSKVEIPLFGNRGWLQQDPCTIPNNVKLEK